MSAASSTLTDTPDTTGAVPTAEDASAPSAPVSEVETDTAADATSPESTPTPEAPAADDPRQVLKAFQAEMEPYKGFIEALKADPVAALQAVAPQLGLTVTPATPAPSPEEQAAQATAHTLEVLKQHLGPEYEDLAERLAPALGQVAAQVVAEQTKPLQSRQTQLAQESAQREAAATLEAFGKTHPDWKTHEKAMEALGQKVQPGPGTSELDWLEMLYTLASKDTQVREQAQQTVTRMVKSAAKAGGGPGSVPADKVADRPATAPTFREAYAAAKAGRRLE